MKKMNMNGHFQQIIIAFVKKDLLWKQTKRREQERY